MFRLMLKICSLALFLVGCGSNDNKARIKPTTPPPSSTNFSVNAGSDQDVNENTSFELNGIVSGTDQQDKTYRWTQTSGKKSTINDPSQLTNPQGTTRSCLVSIMVQQINILPVVTIPSVDNVNEL